MDDYTTISVPRQAAGEIKILVKRLKFYIERDKLWADLAFKKNITQKQIADQFGITKQAVSIKYPRLNKEIKK